MTNIVTKEKLNEMLNNEEIRMRVIGRALVHLRNRQTQDEQIEEKTKHSNLRGFQPADARMGTSMASYYERFGKLSEKQQSYWMIRNCKGTMRLSKYWRQLDEEAKKKVS
jgi:hypothetical protein